METFFEIRFEIVMKTREKEDDLTQIKNRIGLESLGCFYRKKKYLSRRKQEHVKERNWFILFPKIKPCDNEGVLLPRSSQGKPRFSVWPKMLKTKKYIFTDIVCLKDSTLF